MLSSVPLTASSIRFGLSPDEEIRKVVLDSTVKMVSAYLKNPCQKPMDSSVVGDFFTRLHKTVDDTFSASKK